MKISKLLLFLALLGHCFSDECENEFQTLIKNQCEKIDNSCSFFDLRCISKNDNDCSRGDGDLTTCNKIFHKDFPTKKCVYNSPKCKPDNTVCSDFNYLFAGVRFDPLIDRSYCDGFSAITNGKRCHISNSRSCQEYFSSCNGLSDPGCTNNLISYKRECKMVGGTCTEVDRNCDNPLYNVNEEECRTLNPTNANQKCVYTSGVCTAEFISCVNHGSTDCNNKRPLIQNGNEYDLSKKCIYNTPSTGTGSCEEEKEDCSLYTGDDKTVCPNLKVSDPIKKRCVYDQTSTSPICKEEYKTCQLYNDMETSKRREDCESISLDDQNKKCIYINEIDK